MYLEDQLYAVWLQENGIDVLSAGPAPTGIEAQAEVWGLSTLSPTLANPEQVWGPIHFSDGMPEYGELPLPSSN